MLKKFLLRKFKDGRQGTGYKVWTIYESLEKGIDLHLIYYPKGSYIPMHRDPLPIEFDAEKYRIERTNVLLWDCKKGGNFVYENMIRHKAIKSFLGRVTKFDPSIIKHSVTMVREGSRLVLSFGKIKEK